MLISLVVGDNSFWLLSFIWEKYLQTDLNDKVSHRLAPEKTIMINDAFHLIGQYLHFQIINLCMTNVPFTICTIHRLTEWNSESTIIK